jgi:hypothetical protein
MRDRQLAAATDRRGLWRLKAGRIRIRLPQTPLPWPCEQPASARWGGAQATRRPPQGADCQRDGTRCLEGHYALGPQRVHLLGRRCQAAEDSRAPHSPDPGGVGGRSAPAVLLAWLQPPRAHWQEWRWRRLARARRSDSRPRGDVGLDDLSWRRRIRRRPTWHRSSAGRSSSTRSTCSNSSCRYSAEAEIRLPHDAVSCSNSRRRCQLDIGMRSGRRR